MSMPRCSTRCPICPTAARELVELGCHHEEQHQELLLTDMLPPIRENPLEPAVWPRRAQGAGRDARRRSAGSSAAAGMVEIGHDGDGFAFDCEGPRHQALLAPHALADRTVTNGEWAAFIADGGYARPAALAVRRLGLGEGRRRSRRRFTGSSATAAGRASGSTAAARSIPPRRSRMSASSRPTPMPAGPARGCRPRPNGKPPPRRTIPTAATSSTPPARSSRARRRAARPSSATSGNGPAAPIAPIPASARRGRGRRI